MRIIVMGAGVVGVLTAYILHQRGHQVEVIERNHSAALECSFANGGQLSYNHTEPWSNPDALKKGLKWLGQDDAPLLFRIQKDPQMWLWTMRFLLNCTHSRALKNNETMLRLALYSRTIMHRITTELPLDFDYAKTGRMVIFEDKASLASHWKLMEHQHKVQPASRGDLLNPKQCVDIEPALAHHASHIVGGIFCPDDESGDICKFTQGVAHYLQSQGVIFHYHTAVQKLVRKRSMLQGIITSKGDMTADAFVMSLGCVSASLLRKINIHAPIYPLKGYSISVDIQGCAPHHVPKISMTHASKKLAYSTLGDRLRLAGTAEFAGYNDKVVKHRIDILKRDTKEIFPYAGNPDTATEWACLRPMTPDGPPIIGTTSVDNLFMNTGQGYLGWTEAAGSAAIIADILENKQPAISIKGMELSRFMW